MVTNCVDLVYRSMLPAYTSDGNNNFPSCVSKCEYRTLICLAEMTFAVPFSSCVLRPASCVSIRIILSPTSSLRTVPAIVRNALLLQSSLHSTLVPIRDAGRRTQDAGRPFVKKPTSTQLRIRDAGRGLVRKVAFLRLKIQEIGRGACDKHVSWMKL